VVQAPPPTPDESGKGSEQAAETQTEDAASDSGEVAVASSVRVTAITAEQAGAVLAERRPAPASSSSAAESPIVEAQTVAPTVAALRGETPFAAVGAIADPGYRQIESLLFAPAATHAPRFMERYTESIREFRERHSIVPDGQTTPLPSDEEMGAYNAAMHAWLDTDAERRSTADWQGSDGGGVTANWFSTGSGFEQLLASTTDAFTRPGLPALQSIQGRPGLAEGLSKLGG